MAAAVVGAGLLLADAVEMAATGSVVDPAAAIEDELATPGAVGAVDDPDTTWAERILNVIS